jgi:hypothetical protein
MISITMGLSGAPSRIFSHHETLRPLAREKLKQAFDIADKMRGQQKELLANLRLRYRQRHPEGSHWQFSRTRQAISFQSQDGERFDGTLFAKAFPVEVDLNGK